MAIKTYVNKTINVSFLFAALVNTTHIAVFIPSSFPGFSIWIAYQTERERNKNANISNNIVCHAYAYSVVMLKCFRFWNGIFSPPSVCAKHEN